MGTKRDPGPHDCYASADPDEPMFILLARDPAAAALVDLWAVLRNATEENPVQSHDVAVLMCEAMDKIRASNNTPSPDKIAEAHLCAAEMRLFYIKRQVAKAKDKTEQAPKE